MKTSVYFACVMIILLGMSVCSAGSDIPNLVGTWTVKAEGGAVIRGNAPGPITHHREAFSALNAEALITKQQGRIMHGTFKSAVGSENFIAGIGLDNKTFYYADHDGFCHGKIIDKDTIEVVYRHITAIDTVLGIGVWTRKK